MRPDILGNTQSMDLLDKLEIYIPVEAEVKSIPLWSLPNSVLRRMGLPLPDSESSRKLGDSPKGIWIGPAVVRRKGQKPASQTGNGVKENMSSLLGREFRGAPGPFQMSFVSANRAAYRVLKDAMPGKKVSAHTSHSLPLGSAPRIYRDAVIIYHGRIYLSIRKPSQSQSRRETREPQPASKSSESQKKRQSPQAPLEPADKELQRKRLRVTSPQMSPKQPKDLLTKTDNHSTTDQELLNDSKVQDLVCEEAESTSQNNDMNNIQIDSGEPANTVGVVEQSSSQSWTRRESPGAAGEQQFDYEDLEQEEVIARMKAKLRKSEAALNNLPSS